MSDVKWIGVVDCSDKLAEFKQQYQLTDEDLSAIMVAGCTHELDGIYVDPIFTSDVAINIATASKLARAIKELLSKNIVTPISNIVHNARDNEVLKFDYEISGNLVIIKMGLCEEEY